MSIKLSDSLVLFFILMASAVAGQTCSLQLEGYILDKGTDIPLEYANIFIEESGIGTATDSTGAFSIHELCPGNYHLRISHIGCETKHLFIDLASDTSMVVRLSHHAELLNEVLVHGSSEENTTEVSSSIDREKIAGEGNKNLSDILESIAGVSTLKTGSGISKPVIHGLYGNRVTILNNGIAQAGQQWGNDHAPEIDPFVADHLSVIKGAGALAYPGNSLGGVVLVEPDQIGDDPHLHGEVNYIFQSNGLGHTLNADFSKAGKWARWRLMGTVKRKGDNSAPDYFLTNTGKREANISLQAQKKLNESWDADLYYSLFNTEIGILRGSHIGNLSDLEEAIGRDEPLFTEDEFSYSINPPRQTVSHHLVKTTLRHFLSQEKVLKFTYSGQFNQRKEFDVRRSGRSDLPALSLDHLAHFFEAIYNGTYDDGLFVKAGLQFTGIDNENDPETGILPLIPDYISYSPSAFLIMQKDKGDTFYELGARYEFRALDVTRISDTIPRTIERIDHRFHNLGFSAGLKKVISSKVATQLNVAWKTRAPGINELYSSGLHQGVSGIEEGDPTLDLEQSLKFTLSGDLKLEDRLFFQALFYGQLIRDYIYLQVQDEFRLTIRGAFPVFTYEQTDARIAGMDLLLKYEPVDKFNLLLKYAMVRGRDIDQRLPLVFMPADNVSGIFTYRLPDGRNFSNSYIEVNSSYTFEQTRLEPEQDFLPPPNGYFLLGLRIASELELGNAPLQISLSVENLLNKEYRDYLNRLRYFADETGIDVRLGIRYLF